MMKKVSLFNRMLIKHVASRRNNLRTSAGLRSNRVGYVLGWFQPKSEEGTVADNSAVVQEYTATTKLVNEQLNGNLHKALQLTKPLKEGASRLITNDNEKYPLVSVVGIGSRSLGLDTTEHWHAGRQAVRCAVAAGVRSLDSNGVNQIHVDACGYADAAAEAATLSLYKFDDYKTKGKQSTAKINLLDLNDDVRTERAWSKGVVYGQAQNLARSLADQPANQLTPLLFAQKAQTLLKDTPGVTVHLRDRSWCLEKGMGAFMSVAQGSTEAPVLLEIHVSPEQTQQQYEQPLVLVGKGVTFDSGGYSLKPAGKMWAMRADMMGAACVLGAVQGYSLLTDIKQRQRSVIALCPLTENMINGQATRPGDVVHAMNGKSIEIWNTDAEGRLILADALCYADEFNPHHVLELSTLTGVCVQAMGGAAAAVFASDEQLWTQLYNASTTTGDRIWRMPFWKLYVSYLKSSAADLNNIGKGGHGGGMCTAAAFVKEFTKCKSFAHFDIASVMEADSELAYLTAGSVTGRPTRLLIEWLMKNNTNNSV